MTDKQSHTPTPWTIVNAPRNAGLHGRIYARGSVVADVHIQPDGIDAANAAHIVRCVNAHDKLVAALRDLLNACEGIGGGINSDGAMNRWTNAKYDARAVLAEVDREQS